MLTAWLFHSKIAEEKKQRTLMPAIFVFLLLQELNYTVRNWGIKNHEIQPPQDGLDCELLAYRAVKVPLT